MVIHGGIGKVQNFSTLNNLKSANQHLVFKDAVSLQLIASVKFQR